MEPPAIGVRSRDVSRPSTPIVGRLSLPGSSGSSLEPYRQRMGIAMVSRGFRTGVAFFIFGLMNNILYVIVLSAALDLVGPTIPKGVVLLADVVPGFLFKCIAPYFFHVVPYHIRILLFIGFSFAGMQLVAQSSGLTARLLGIVLASMSSGAGELSFLQLTHWHDKLALPGFAVGTGMAGLAGAYFYLAMTTWIGLTPHTSLNISSFLPYLLAVAYFLILPSRLKNFGGYESLPTSNDEESTIRVQFPLGASERPSFIANLRRTTRRIQPLVIPYMAPLFLVYVSEYTINQGITPTLLFPLAQMPFTSIRDAYPTYQTLYQLGVFISRSSSTWIRIHNIYLPSIIQFCILCFLTLQALFVIIPSIYPIFIIIFCEGILGGLVYVNAFHEVQDREHVTGEREFALGAVGMADSGGIAVAGFVSILLEPALCGYQVNNGRPWCRMI